MIGIWESNKGDVSGDEISDVSWHRRTAIAYTKQNWFGI